MAFAVFYPTKSPVERRNMYYRSPWWNSNPYHDAISNYFDCWVNGFNEPGSYTVIRRPVRPVQTNQQDVGQDSLKDKEAAQSSSARNEETFSQSQATSNAQTKQSKKPRQDSNTSTTGNASEKAKQKSSTSSKKHPAMVPWFSPLDVRPWHSFADIFGEWASDDFFTSHDEDNDTDGEHSSSEGNSQNITTSRSYTEYQMGSNSKNKYSYHKSSFKKGNGERKTVITQSIGDQKHTITTIVDAEGNEHQTEAYVNVEENGMQKFKESLKKYQIDHVDNPKPQQLCNEQANTDQSNTDQSNTDKSSTDQSKNESSEQQV